MVKLWENRHINKESQQACEEGCFPKYFHSLDLMGDTLDEYSDSVASELKAIALWGGKCHHKAALMAYNDFKIADALLSAMKQGGEHSYPMTTRDYSNVIQFAKLVSSNRSSLIRTGEVVDIPVTEQERQDYAVKCYKNKRFFLKHPPKKAMTNILKRIGPDIENPDSSRISREKVQKTRDDIEDYVKWDSNMGAFKSSNQSLSSNIVADLTDVYNDLHS